VSAPNRQEPGDLAAAQDIEVGDTGRAYSVGQGNLIVNELAAEPGSESSTVTPGLFSVAPPLGELPVRVRGRDAILDQLSADLDGPVDRVHVLHGLGGCGKTTIALRLAHIAQERGLRVFWISVASQDQLLTGMRQVAHELDIDSKDIEDAWTGQTSAIDLVWRHLDASSDRWRCGWRAPIWPAPRVARACFVVDGVWRGSAPSPRTPKRWGSSPPTSSTPACPPGGTRLRPSACTAI
jgi:hypothetical protein